VANDHSVSDLFNGLINHEQWNEEPFARNDRLGAIRHSYDEWRSVDVTGHGCMSAVMRVFEG
jgi:hypothetical protein